MNQKLKEKTLESLSSVLPVAGIVLALSIFLVPLDVGNMMIFLVSTVMLIVGMGMFQLGAETAMTPLGEGIGGELSKSKNIGIIIAISFVMGALITIAEPDLQVLSNQVPSVPNSVLIWTVAIGVGIFLTLAVMRIILKIDLSILLIILYIALLALSFFVPQDFLAVAFDSGGVTTGPMTVPFIMAMGLGLSSMRGDKDASSDSFGLVAISSIGPILAVMALGCFYAPQETSQSASEIASVGTMRDVMKVFAVELPHYAREVLVSLLPIMAVYVVFQLIRRKYQKRQQIRVAVGFIYTYIGLVLFLCGVNVGFAPIGTMIGGEIAGSSYKWIIIPIGIIMGYFIVRAEPAVQILNHQVQAVTSGTISGKAMNHCLSIGVGISIGLAVLRILTGLPIQWIIIPGYIVALIMSRFVPKIFVGIAFDSGGVASGPMTSTFLLPFCIGACGAVGGNMMTDAFGVVALVALTPLIAIQIMGLQYKFKLNKQMKITKPDNMIPEDSDAIVEFTEE
ncbi:MAG TPA: DUF1538 domain-containing protein [Firmicutes bacterium]|nr:DUF1538 domain-containing protein [Bacillota bacterium]